MAFQKGEISNPSGRPKGSENKETKKIRELIGELLDNNMAKLQDDINELTPKDRVAAVTGLLEYAVPKLQRTELTDAEGNKFTLHIVNYSDAK